MGLDGGTLASRSDLLRRASWRLSAADGRRSSRGGQLGALEATAAACVESRSRVRDEADGYSTCALSGDPLPPHPAPGEVVGCGLGQLYLRDNVVMFLARSERFDPATTDIRALEVAFGHLRSLRDIFPLQLEPNPRRAETVFDVAPGQSVGIIGAWRCPIDKHVETLSLIHI